MIGSARRGPARAVDPRVILSLAIALAIAAACTAHDRPAGPVAATPAMVVPDGAAIDVGTDGPGLDDGVPFFAFRSPLSPSATRTSYARDLVTAGYEARGDRDGWTLYVRGTDRLAVRVADTGPPTSIVVKVLPTLVAGEPDLPTSQPAGTSALGEPDPPHGPALTDPTKAPATGQGGGTGQGQGGGTGGQGQGGGTGNGQGQGGSGTGGGRPSATPAPVVTEAPTPTPTPKPKPTQKPKPTPKPTSTPRPTPSDRGPGGNGPPGGGGGGPGGGGGGG